MYWAAILDKKIHYLRISKNKTSASYMQKT